jgi:hypothetical protein
MNANEIKTGSDYMVKIGRNEVRVKVLGGNASDGWFVGIYSSGKSIPVRNPERFVRCLEGAGEPAQESRPESEAPDTESQDLRTQVSDIKPKMSMLNAVIKILETAVHPMSAKEIIAAMEAENLWKSPGGKTPHNTLSAAIGKELRDKENPRFQKTAPGLYALANEEGDDANA